MDLTTITTCILLPQFQYNMGDNTTFTRAYYNRVSSHLWVVVVVVLCSELTWPQICKVSSFNNTNVIWVIIQVLMDLTTIKTNVLLSQFLYNMGDNTTLSRAYCNRVNSHLWVVVVVLVSNELTWPQSFFM